MKLPGAAPTALLVATVVTTATLAALTTTRHDHDDDGHTDASESADVRAVAGFTKMTFTERWVVVVNVLPAEPMFTHDEAADLHPSQGELIVHGGAVDISPTARHVEAHVYDRSTGLPVTSPEPELEVLVHATGERITIEPTLMQDVVVGEPDLHFGNNVELPDDTDLTITVTVGDEEVSIDGHLA